MQPFWDGYTDQENQLWNGLVLSHPQELELIKCVVGPNPYRFKAPLTRYSKRDTPLAGGISYVLTHKQTKLWIGLVPATLGCVVIDIDDLDYIEVVEEICGPPWVMCESLSGKIHYWYKINPSVTSCPGTWAGGDIIFDKRYVVMADPERWIKAYPQLREIESKELTRVEIDTLAECIASTVRAEGDRNNTLNNEVFRAALAKDNKAIEAAEKKSLKSGLPPAEVTATVASAIKAAAEVNSSGKPMVTDEDIVTSFLKILKLEGIVFYYDELMQKILIKLPDETEPHEISDITSDMMFHTIALKYVTMQKDKAVPFDIKTDMIRGRILRIASRRKKVNLPLRWLNSLAISDNDYEQLETWGFDSFGIEDTPLHRFGLKCVFLNAAMGIMSQETGFLTRATPLFVGPRGIGKSTLVRELLPLNLRRYHTESVRLDYRDDKELAETLGGMIVAEVSELLGLRKADWDKLKHLLVRKSIRSRMAYGRHPQTYNRTWSFIATANIETLRLPSDRDAAARFMKIVCTKGCDVTKFMEGTRDRLWALARDYIISEQLTEIRVPDWLEEQVAEAVKSNLLVNEVAVDWLLNLAAEPPDVVEGEGYTSKKTSSAAYRLSYLNTMAQGAGLRIPPAQLLDALVQAGWVQERRRAARLWVPPPQEKENEQRIQLTAAN